MYNQGAAWVCLETFLLIIISYMYLMFFFMISHDFRVLWGKITTRMWNYNNHWIVWYTQLPTRQRTTVSDIRPRITPKLVNLPTFSTWGVLILDPVKHQLKNANIKIDLRIKLTILVSDHLNGNRFFMPSHFKCYPCIKWRCLIDKMKQFSTLKYFVLSSDNLNQMSYLSLRQLHLCMH